MTTDKKARKEMPIARGVLDYFPDAVAAVANVSYVGNQQHNPAQEMFWSKGKSNDHADCLARHLLERGKLDDDGLRHSAKAAWRALAMLQVEIENGRAPAPNRFVQTEESVTRHAEDHVYRMNFTEAQEPTKPQQPHPHRRRLADLLDNLGCNKMVTEEIIDGTRLQNSQQYVYIAGPMRGYPEFNFPAFDKARDEFLQNGWNVISPADIDRAAGFSQSVPDQPLDQRTFAYRDFYALFLLAHLKNGAIAMLHGWEKSTGAVAEFFLARWLGLKILDAQSGQLLKVICTGDIYGKVHDFFDEQR